jgi:hypothetical protein
MNPGHSLLLLEQLLVVLLGLALALIRCKHSPDAKIPNLAPSMLSFSAAAAAAGMQAI